MTTAQIPHRLWLPRLVHRLGVPETDPELQRWTWQDGELGVFVDQLTHAWQAVAWAPDRSVTLRSLAPPTDADLTMLADFAGLHTHGATP